MGIPESLAGLSISRCNDQFSLFIHHQYLGDSWITIRMAECPHLLWNSVWPLRMGLFTSETTSAGAVLQFTFVKSQTNPIQKIIFGFAPCFMHRLNHGMSQARVRLMDLGFPPFVPSPLDEA